MEWLTEDSVSVPVGREHHEKMRFCYIGWVYTWKQRPLYDAIPARAKRHGPGSQGMAMKVDFLTIIPSKPLAEYLLPGPTTLKCAGLEILVSKPGMLQLWGTRWFHWIGRCDCYLAHLGSLWQWINRQKEVLLYLLECFIQIAKGESGCCYTVVIYRTKSENQRICYGVS